MENNIEKTAEIINEKLANKVDRNEVDALKLQVKDLESAAEALTAKMQGLTGVENKKENTELVSFRNLSNSYKAAKKRQTDDLLITNKTPIKVTSEVVKAAGIFNTTTHVDAGVTMPLREAGFTRVPLTQSFLLTNYIRVIGVTAEKFDKIEWIEQYAKQGAAAYVEQGATKPLIDSKRKKNSVDVVKIVGASEFTQEYLEDVDSALEEIRYDANLSILTQIESGLVNGTGIDQLKGVLAYAKTLNDVSFQNKFADPTLFHVLLSGLQQIKKHLKNANPNLILVSSGDMVSLIGMMDANQNGINLRFVTYDNGILKVMGVPVVEHSDIADDHYVIGDFTKMTLKYRTAMREAMTDSHGENFLDNVITYIRELRAASYIRENETEAFVKGDFTIDLTFITVI